MNIRKFVNNALVILGMCAVVTFGWQGIELLMTGKTNPNSVDTVVGIILTYSLLGNLKSWNKSRKGDE